MKSPKTGHRLFWCVCCFELNLIENHPDSFYQGLKKTNPTCSQFLDINVLSLFILLETWEEEKIQTAACSSLPKSKDFSFQNYPLSFFHQSVFRQLWPVKSHFVKFFSGFIRSIATVIGGNNRTPLLLLRFWKKTGVYLKICCFLLLYSYTLPAVLLPFFDSLKLLEKFLLHVESNCFGVILTPCICSPINSISLSYCPQSWFNVKDFWYSLHNLQNPGFYFHEQWNFVRTPVFSRSWNHSPYLKQADDFSLHPF